MTCANVAGMGVRHYTPDEPWFAECGGGGEGDYATLNPDLVTCRGCLTMMAVIREVEGD